MSFASLDQDLLERYIELLKKGKPRLAAISNDEIYELMSIKRDKRITLSAVMNFCPYPQAYFPQLCIIATVVPGTEVGTLGDQGERFTDNQRIEGNISDMLDGAMQFVNRNMRIKTIINPHTGKREDRPDYPITAVREAVLNALVHRDYSIHTEGMPIQLIMFEDRMEIRNPGRFSQNPVIASELEVLKVTENRYSGIPTIRRMMQEYDLQQPEFIDERGSFIVKLYKDVMEQTAVEMDRADNRELLLFCKTPRTRKEISDYLGLNSVTYAIQTRVMPLVERGIIKMSIPEKPKSPKQLFYCD